MTEKNVKVTMYFPADKTDRDTGELVGEREVSGEGPLAFTVDTVRYWSRHTRELKGNQVTKAEHFVRYDCLHYLGNNRFVCLPLNTSERVVFEGREFLKRGFGKDYNNSEYIIDREERTFRCSCQGWDTKRKRNELVPEGANCSHVLALFYAFKLGRFKREPLRVEWPESIKGDSSGSAL